MAAWRFGRGNRAIEFGDRIRRSNSAIDLRRSNSAIDLRRSNSAIELGDQTGAIRLGRSTSGDNNPHQDIDEQSRDATWNQGEQES
jgi:hypothetical protein